MLQNDLLGVSWGHFQGWAPKCSKMTHTVGRPPHVLIGGVDRSGYRQPGAFTPRADRRFCIQLDFVNVGRLPRVLIGGFASKWISSSWGVYPAGDGDALWDALHPDYHEAALKLRLHHSTAWLTLVWT